MRRQNKRMADPAFEMTPLPQRLLLSAATAIPAAWTDGTNEETPVVSAKATLAPANQTHSAQQRVQQTPVTVSLTTNRNRFNTGEPILMTFTVSNHSKKTIFFYTPFTPFYYPAEALAVKSGTQMAHWAGPRIQFVWARSQFRPVAAGRSISITIDLNALYRSDRTYPYRPGLAPGQWSVRLLAPQYSSAPLSSLHSWSLLKSAPAVGRHLQFTVATANSWD